MTLVHSRSLSRFLAVSIRIGTATACCLAFWLAENAATAQPASEPSPIEFSTTTTFSVNIGSEPSHTLWKRELMRQSLLLAARAEMNYPIVDDAIGEGISASKPSFQLACIAGNPNRIELLHGLPDERARVWTLEFRFDSPWPHHRAWVERMEVMSRTSFVEALETAKFARQPGTAAKQPSSALDPGLVRLVDEDLSFVGQFLALRQLHEAVAADGETSARVAGLVRAYAHLGLLTEYQWHPMSYAFKARALLYAQRWAVREPNSKSALQHRAYAFALVGMHADALADLQAAAKLADEAPADGGTPAWIPLIEHFCRYDFQKLNALRADQHLKPLASLLYFLSREQETSSLLVITVGRELLKESPGCYRILDTLCHQTGPGIGDALSQAGSRHLARSLLPRLAQTSGLPRQVRAALDEAQRAGAILTENSPAAAFAAEIEHRAKVMAALRTSPMAEPSLDRGEPSWQVLAQITEETSYLQVYHRAYFLLNQIGVPIDDYLDATRPVVMDHRYAGFLEVCRRPIDLRKFAAEVRGFYHGHNDFAHARLWNGWADNDRQKSLGTAQSHKEGLPNELGLAARMYPFEVNVRPGPLLAVSPHSPYAMALALRTSPQEQPQAETAWEESAPHSPYLARSLGDVWTKRGNPAKAERFLKLATELDPSQTNYRLLANHYKAQGDEENWLKALNDYLKTPSLGLTHARIQCEIAEHYADRREWDKALPYADAAAETGAQWALIWARGINEANQNWEAAEQFQVAEYQRYGAHPVAWYYFCQRNGVGDLQLAREAAFPNGVDAFAASSKLPVAYVAMALSLEGKPSKALALYEQALSAVPDPWVAMQAALTADVAGDNAQRDAMLKRVIEQPPPAGAADKPPPWQDLIDLARHLTADLAAGGKAELDFAKLHEIRDQAPERNRCDFNYFLARYLDRHGKPDLAVEYWKQCMGYSALAAATRTAAGFELHKRGVKPGQWKELLFAKPENAK